MPKRRLVRVAGELDLETFLFLFITLSASSKRATIKVY